MDRRDLICKSKCVALQHFPRLEKASQENSTFRSGMLQHIQNLTPITVQLSRQTIKLYSRANPLFGWWRGGIVFVYFCAFLHVLLYTRSCTCTIMNRYPSTQLHFLLHHIFYQLTCFIWACLTRSQWDTSAWSDRCSTYIVEIILFVGMLLLWKLLQNLRVDICDHSATLQEIKDLRTEF